MGKRRECREGMMRSQTSPPSPTHSSSSSSSDFEFTISISPRKASTSLCPADELFYKGQLLPLHLSPRLSMVRTLLSSSSTSSSSDTTTAASRDSTGSTSSTDSTASFPLLGLRPGSGHCDSSRPSSVSDEHDDFQRPLNVGSSDPINNHPNYHINKKNARYFSLARFSSVFKKEPKNNRDHDTPAPSSSSVKRMSSSAREVIRKYLKKVKPLYDKLSQKQQQQQQHNNNKMTSNGVAVSTKTERCIKEVDEFSQKKDAGGVGGAFSVSFSGNLKYPRRKRCAASCPSSMRSSPSHSGVLTRNGFLGLGLGFESTGAGPSTTKTGTVYCSGGDTMSSMEELQNAIQGAIAHCKNSMMQNDTKNKNMNINIDMVRNEI